MNLVVHSVLTRSTKNPSNYIKTLSNNQSINVCWEKNFVFITFLLLWLAMRPRRLQKTSKPKLFAIKPFDWHQISAFILWNAEMTIESYTKAFKPKFSINTIFLRRIIISVKNWTEIKVAPCIWSFLNFDLVDHLKKKMLI